VSGLVLHNYFRSSTSIRLRVALNLKRLDYRYVAYHLRKGENRSPAYLAINPQGLVPALELDDGEVLTQSLAIIEYLDEIRPTPPLLPKGPFDRARVRALACAVACEIHAVNNLRILKHLRIEFGADDSKIAAWYRYWVGQTFLPLEKMLAGDARAGRFCHGDEPGLADLCLFAQVVNNRRFDFDMSPFATIRRIYENCLAVPAFASAMPEVQIDAE
jgi:maleylpyruvate isomerase